MQRILDSIGNKMNDKLLKQCFLYTYILGLAAHAYCFLNLTISHDSLRAFYIAGKWPKASLGRIFYPAYITMTRGKIVLPWLIGALALFWISIAVYLIVRLFRMEKRVLVLLIAGILVTNPSFYATAATYIHDLDANAFAILLSVFTVCLWERATSVSKMRDRLMLLASGGTLLSVALGIYQSYVSVAITLIMFVSVRNLFEGKKAMEVFKQGIWSVVMLASAAGLYLIEVKIFSHFTGISILNNESYNGLGNMSQVLSGNVFMKILDTYKNFVTPFKNLIVTSETSKVIFAALVILAIGVIGITVMGIKKMDWPGRGLLVLLGVLMPFGMNISSFLSNGMYHVLMQYAVWFFYLFALILVWWISMEKNIPDKIRKIVGIAVLVCVSLLIFENIQTANTIYIKKDLESQAALSYMTRVADRMEEQEEYIPGETPVVFIGEYAVGESLNGFEKYEVITGVEYHSPITFYDTYKDYFRYELGRPISLEDADAFENNQQVIEMPVFPKEGSVTMIDSTLVVKLK